MGSGTHAVGCRPPVRLELRRQNVGAPGLAMVIALPPTSAYPSDPSPLERERLESLYLELRGNYKSLMISRGVHRSNAERRGSQLKELEQRLRALAIREASVRKQAYRMLEIVTDVVEHLEEAGDDLSGEFAEYQKGGGAYSGGTRIGRLIRALIRFLNRWRLGKEKFEALSQQQASWRESFQPEPTPPEQLSTTEKEKDGPDR